MEIITLLFEFDGLLKRFLGLFLKRFQFFFGGDALLYQFFAETGDGIPLFQFLQFPGGSIGPRVTLKCPL